MFTKPEVCLFTDRWWIKRLIFMSGCQSFVSLWWWHFRWVRACAILLEEDQSACVPLKPLVSFMTQPQQGLPLSSSLSLFVCFDHTVHSVHISPCCFSFLSFGALFVKHMSHDCPFFIRTTTSFCLSAHVGPPPLETFCLKPSLPPVTPAIRCSVGLSRVISKP